MTTPRALRLMLLALAVAACSDGATPGGARANFEVPVDPASGPRLTGVDDAIEPFVRSGAIVGAAALVVHRGRIVHRAAYGWRDSDHRSELRIVDRFRIASMTKPVVSVAALILAERGALGLDDAVSSYLPSFAEVGVYAGAGRTQPPARTMTIRHLLTHTSGITSDADPAATLSEFADAVARRPLAADPGTAWIYGHSTNVLARVLEVAARAPLDDVLEREIFVPLRMTHTGFYVPDGAGDTLVAAHSLAASGLPFVVRATTATTTPPSFLSGNGGLLSTLDDYGRFASMLAGGGSLDELRLLSPATVEEMTRNQLVAPFVPTGTASLGLPGQGFGLGVAVVQSTSASGHFANVGAFHWAGAWNTWFWVDPAAQIVGILLMQYEPLGAYPIDRAFGSAVYTSLQQQ